MQAPASPLEVAPANTQWTKQCIVIPVGVRPELIEILAAAAGNDAMVDNSDEEAGDDEYAVQFPGHDQELLDQDQIAARLRELLNPGEDDE